MSNKNDRWSALSMKERADLMNMYITNGISDLKEMKKHYNSFGPGGFMLPINPIIVEEQLVKKPLRNAAYRFGSDEEVQQKGYAGIYDLLRIMNPLYKSTNPMDDNKTMFLYGNVNGLPPANNSNGKDFSEYIKSTYPTKDVKSYQGVINPFDEYVIDNRDKGLIEELAKKGKDLYINADTEYVNMGPDDFKYRDDVASYNAQFVNTDKGPAISAADLYDFGPDYNPAKYNEDLSKTDSFLGNLESKLLSYVGTPYILRQDNIPIRFIDYNNASLKDIDRANMLKAAITHGTLSEKDKEKGIDLDSKLAEILGNGYIEPSVVTAESKKAKGGKLNSFSGEEDTNKKPFFDPQKIVDNVPAREWGPQIVLGENDYLVKPGTNILAAPIQYYADKNTGKQNIETANKIISDFESLEDKQRHIDDETDTYLAYLDALHYLNHAEALKKYLGLPYDTNRLKESNYKPTRLQGSDEKVYKFSNEEDPKYWGSVVNDMLLGNHNKKQYVDGTLNTFTAYRDFDDKGDFISIYDEWDYNPSVQGGFKPLNKIIDVATGGKPFIVYDRIYLDDYYDVPEAFRGNPYIAPAILTDTNAYMSVDYANGGKILNTNKFSGTEQFPPKNLQQNNLMPANASTAFLQSVINTDQKIWPGQITSEDRLSPTEKAWKAANLQYEKFLNDKKQLETYTTGEDNSELITITAPNTDISKFIFNNQISKNAIQEINRVALLRKQDPYDILAHMLIESSGMPLTTTEYYNTHNVIDKQINPRYLNYYYDDREKQLKQFGIYQEGKEHTSEELEKAMSKFNKQRSETLKKVIKPESSIDAVALYMMLNGRDFNPAQKGSLTTGGVVKNSYLDMIDSAVFSLKKNMPDLFK